MVGRITTVEAMHWLAEHLASQGISYHYKTDSLRQNGEVIDHRVATAALRIAAHGQSDPAVRRLLFDLLTVWKYEQQRLVLDRIVQSIGYSKGAGLVSTWTKAVSGRSDPLDIAVVQHFVWQVKRKLRRMSVEHHLMPILYGRSGGGKSVAVRRLLEPVDEVTLVTNMGVFEDRFGKRQFTRNFVMFFDELDGCGLVDVNKLKQVITASVQEWRVMHSEGVASAPQNCTFIGCSNDPVAERIKDPTSARRFWQLDCADKLDWDAINAIDYAALWRSVDESASCPILPYIDEIRRRQDADIRAKDVIEQWLEQCCRPEPFHGDSPTTSVLFDYFRSWCQWQGATSHPGFQSFSRALGSRLKMLGWEVESKHGNSGTVWPLAISRLPQSETA